MADEFNPTITETTRLIVWPSEDDPHNVGEVKIFYRWEDAPDGPRRFYQATPASGELLADPDFEIDMVMFAPALVLRRLINLAGLSYPGAEGFINDDSH